MPDPDLTPALAAHDAAWRELVAAEAMAKTIALGQVATLESALSLAETQLGILRGERDAAIKAFADHMTEVHPEPEPATLMGVTVNGAVRSEYTDLHPAVQVARVFWDDMGEDWAQEPEHKRFPGAKYAVSCTNSVTAERLEARLANLTDADKASILWFCYVHEPENPSKGLNPAEHRAKQARMHEIVRRHGLKAASCLMGYTLQPNSGRNWREWIDPAAVDLLAWDKYNSGNKKSPPVYQDPVQMIDEALAASAEWGKPWALWETGTNRFGDEAPRVEWTRKLRAYATEQGAEALIWFDRKSTSGSTWDATLDRASAEAWLA